MVASQNDGGRSVGGGGESETVYTVTVSGVGYRNEGYKDDGNDCIPPEPQKPPQLPPPEDDTQSRRFRLSRDEKWRILKNIGTVSVAFMVQFTAFQGTANLQSSINASDGLGTVSLSAIYAALVLSCIFVPTFLIKRLTVKWTLCLSMLCYAPYIGSQFYPRFYTLVPAGVLLGLGAAPMWAAKATYLTQVGGVYAKLTDQPVDAIVVRFFGFFFLAWQTAELWGNLISSLVLSEGEFGSSGGNSTTSWNKIKLCGAEFCVFGNGAHENLERPPESEIYKISSIYLTCVIVAVIIVALFVDPLSRYGEKQRRADSQELSGIQLLSATAYQLKKPYQQLLIPITVWIGMEQAFIGADFTQAYISCVLGVHKVGYVMICFGVVNAGCSLLFGSLMKFVGRQPLMALGAIVHACLIVVLLLWKPRPDNPYIFYSVSGLWGVGDAVWQTQVNGLYGTLFRRNKEAAFSNYRLWESAGFVIAYAYSTHLCARMKLYVLLTVLMIGTMGYIIVELLHRRKQRRLKAIAEDPKAAQAEANQPEETDDEKDDLDDDIIITHL
ncbi:PREDICTED: UNC93-like protein [Polistes dominula]|uniref:UNC93-like protein n=1 Tax=Polistes dominula TaxID=743375 RepID=A0ABM1I2Y9_POLDO|nr:PREDICTED: UNC93-like protein [Polistes dominula]XP_015174574.1 PREDICTED: UNC93-like protein [Polistes dominula]XP_015174575.1 PREDICTED: UNC93-like protein [Polistes dominula]XP_015174576.1 PREDICTED: UNC93-like protein [Polistes dominula]XP_015174577.1 PREDICTED: UNC93-like protein [Polistes dominula]